LDTRDGVAQHLQRDTVGERPAERLLARLGMAVGHTTILRHVRCGASGGSATLRVAGIDDWAWKKGTTYVQIPIHRGHLLRFDRGQATDLMAATIPI
jgi:hypothetical protein